MSLLRHLSAAIGSLILAASAWTAPTNYAIHQQQIRAGVVVLDESKPSTATYGVSAAPFVLYNLEKANLVKPAGWSFVNPHPAGSVTAAVRARWTEIETEIYGAANDLPVVNQPIAKNNAEYWSVYLSTISDQALGDYDLLVVNPAYYASLSSVEAAKLLKFVDQGGVLWIDPSNLAGQDLYDNFPLAFAMDTGLAGNAYANLYDPLLTTPNSITPTDLNYLHSYLLQGIQAVPADPTGGDFLGLPAQFGQYSTVTAVGGTPTISVARIGDGAIVVTPTGISQILNRVHGTSILGGSGPFNASYTAAAYGSGGALVPGLPVLDDDALAAAKLAINMVSLVAGQPDSRGGARHRGGSLVDVTAPVMTRWTGQSNDANYSTPFTISPTAPPVEYKGVFVATTTSGGNSYITVFKAHIGTDLDGDGDPDDGIGAQGTNLYNGTGTNPLYRDYSVGQPYDVIWVSDPIPGYASPPVCVTVSDSLLKNPNGQQITDEVLVVDANGTLHAFDLFAKNLSGLLTGGVHTELYTINPIALGIQPAFYPDSPYNGAPAQPAAPTVSGDLAFVAEGVQGTNGMTQNTEGVVWIVDLTTGAPLNDAAESSSNNSATNWYVGGSNVVGQPLPAYTGPPTVASIPVQDSSGGYDKVIYGPGIFGTNGGPGFDSLWFGVKGEQPFNVSLSGNTVTITTRAATQSNLPIYDPIGAPAGMTPAQASLLPKLTLLGANGDAIPYNSTIWNDVAPTALQNSGGGVLTFNVDAANYTQYVTGVRVDYTIDWGADPGGNTVSIERGRLLFPLANNGFTTGLPTPPNERILGNIALTPAGTLVMAVSDEDPTHNGANGSLWWVREDQGRGHFRVTGRFSLYPSHQIALTAGLPVTYPPVFLNNDPLVPWLDQQSGSNMFSNALGYFRWAGPPSVVGDNVYALASCSTPYSNTTIQVPVTIAMAFAAEPSTPVFQLPDLSQGFSITQPDFDRSDYGVNPPDVSSTLNQAGFTYDSGSGTLTITNLASTTTGQITDSLSMSHPVIIRNPGNADQLIEPDALGFTWTPLQWYCVYLGNATQSGPLVTGTSLFLASQSTTPNLLTYGTLTPQATVNAMFTNIAPNDPILVNNTSLRPWQKEVPQVTVNASNQIVPDPYILMPDGAAASSWSQYISLLQQTVLGTSTKAYGVIGGGQDIITWGDQGAYGLSRSDFFVCDSGRLIRTDSAGNALYSSDANVTTGPGGGGFAGRVKPMITPSRAYPLDQNDMLIVDAGANRVAKLSESGVEERSITKFFPDVNPANRPNGYLQNEPLNLLSPHDAITYEGFVSTTGMALTVGDNEGSGFEYWIHYLIADSGHKRLVELVDRYTVNSSGQIGPLVTVSMPNPNPVNLSGANTPVEVPQAGVLLWQSPQSVSGKNFNYNSINRVFLGSPGSGVGRYVYVAGIGSTRPTAAQSGASVVGPATTAQSSTGGGGVVIFDPNSPGAIQVYDQYVPANMSGTDFYDPATNAFDIVGPIGGQPQSLNGVTAVTAKTVEVANGGGTTSELLVMVSMANGVFEFAVDPTQPGESLGTPDWFINGVAFTAMRPFTSNGTTLNSANPAQFQPMYAARLDSGDVLIVNGYTGSTAAYNATAPYSPVAGSPYAGEVMMLSGSAFSLTQPNLGFNSASIHFVLPSIVGARNLRAPIFATRR